MWWSPVRRLLEYVWGRRYEIQLSRWQKADVELYKKLVAASCRLSGHLYSHPEPELKQLHEQLLTHIERLRSRLHEAKVFQTVGQASRRRT